MSNDRRMSNLEHDGERYWALAGDMGVSEAIHAYGGASHAASAVAEYLTGDGQHDYQTIYTAVLAYLARATE